MTAIVPFSPNGEYSELEIQTLQTLGVTSQRIYAQTYKLWQEWCCQNNIHPMQLTAQNILAFLVSRSVTQTTRSRQYSAMKKMLLVLSIAYPDWRPHLDYLKLVPVPKDNLANNERDTTALPLDKMRELTEIWHTEGNNISKRNAALIWLLLATGIRRSECAALCWQDVNWDNGIIEIKHAKGGSVRHVAIIYQQAITALEIWHSVSNGEVIFRPLNNSGELTKHDRPMTSDNIYRVVKQAEKILGEKLAPHKLRRSHATQLIDDDASYADVQAQLGHKRATTLLEHYVKPHEAKDRASRFRQKVKL